MGMRRVRVGGANSVSDKDLSLELSGTVFVDTSDYDDRTVPHTIHVLNRIGSSGNMTVKGCGKLVFEHYSDFWGALTVQDTATVAVNPGCGFSSGGKTTVSSGAAVEVAQSGSLSFGRDLTLADGAILGFNFTQKKDAPVLNLTDKTVTVNGEVKVKVTAATGIRPIIKDN